MRYSSINRLPKVLVLAFCISSYNAIQLCHVYVMFHEVCRVVEIAKVDINPWTSKLS